MLKLSKKVDYGLILVSDLYHGPHAANAREMAERHGLPQPMVANILKALSAAGILMSTRGALGGYALSRDVRRISLADLVTALEGPFSLLDCTGDDASCEYQSGCPTHNPIQRVHQRFQQFMAALTLDEVLDRGLADLPLRFGAAAPLEKGRPQ